MKIDHTIRGHTGIAAGDDQKKIEKPSATQTDSLKNEGHVHLSTFSKHVQAPDRGSEMIDAVKVAEIKQAISEGRFKVNPEVVADRLLESVKELLQTKK